jgi:transcriptional regulator with XRE-family HTH domain
MVSRFKALLESLQLSASEFAEKIGVQRSSISHILSGRNKPSVDFLDKIIRAFPEVNIEWLISGNGQWKKSPSIDPSHITATKPDNISPEPKNKRPETSIKDILTEENKIPAQSDDEPVDHIIIVFRNNTFRILRHSREND